MSHRHKGLMKAFTSFCRSSHLERALFLYGLISFVAISALSGVFELPGSRGKQASSFLEFLHQNWQVGPFSDQPGVFLAQQMNDFACALILQDVCYTFNAWGGNSHVGVWFALDPSRNLSKIDVFSDCCHLHKGRAAAPARNLFTGEDRSDLRSLFQELRVGLFLHRAHAAKYRSAGLREGADVTAKDAPHLTRDVGIVAPRDAHLGHFVEAATGLMEVGRHLLGPGGSVPGGGRWNYTFFFPRSSQVGEWSAGVAHIILGTSMSLLSGRHQGCQVCFNTAIFPLNIIHTRDSADLLRVRAAAAAGVQDLVSIPSSSIMATDRPLEALLGSRVHEMKAPVMEKASNIITQQTKEGPAYTNSPKGTRSVEVEEAEHADGRTANLTLHSPGKADELEELKMAWQVTVVKRESTRTVSNLNEILELLRRTFPHLRVKLVTFKDVTVLEQVQTMQRTLFYVSMHGASMSNVIFMRQGSIALELFPYKFVYGTYRRLSLRYGVTYLEWHNVHVNQTSYIDDCLRKGGFRIWSERKCHRHRLCRFCTRDRSITHVHMPEVEALVLQAKRHLDRWLLANSHVQSGLARELSST